jgi:pimeloyl-ACP methyl ester carboxylesterase
MKSPVTADVLHVHGSRDPMMSIDACAGSESFVLGSYALSAMDTGHFPHEENPERFNELLITWLDGE